MPARQFSDAVRKGFNAYRHCRLPVVLSEEAKDYHAQRWAQRAISGDMSQSDWNVCSDCMSKLKPYLAADQASEQQPGGAKSGCFIATACYGSADCYELTQFRRFRDDTPMRSPVGRFAVKAYYIVSPPVATLLRGMPSARRFIRRHVLDRILCAIGGELQGRNE